MGYTRPSSAYPPNWNRMRFYVFQRYNYTCQNCGKYAKGNLHLHHIKPVKKGGGHNFSNLIPLCSECHYLYHQGLINLDICHTNLY